MAKTNPPIRILPMTAEGVGETSVKDVQDRFFLKELASKRRNGRYKYPTSGLDAEPGTIVLFQCENTIIASAVLRDKERFPQPKDGYSGALDFYIDSIRVFDPVGPVLVRGVWPKEFNGFSYSKLKLSATGYPEFERLLTRIRVPSCANSKVLTESNFDAAQELLQPGETGLVLLTDGPYFKVKSDGSGSSGFWNIDPKRHVDRVVIYKRGRGQDGQHIGELYIARHNGLTGTKHTKFTVKLLDVTNAGTTNRSWQEFAGIGQSPVRYVTGNAIREISNLHIAVEDDESAFPEGAMKYRMHRHLERDVNIVRRAKLKRLSETGKLECEACSFDFAATYGHQGAGFIEAHHKIPVSQLNGKTKTKMSELALVCSNCHRILHRGPPILSIDELKVMLQERKRSR